MIFSRLLCAIGVHGPHWFSAWPHPVRSRATAMPYERLCTVCGARWIGDPVDWRQGRETVLWQRTR